MTGSCRVGDGGVGAAGQIGDGGAGDDDVANSGGTGGVATAIGADDIQRPT